MTEVWQHSRAAGTDLLVLLALADIANDERECWPSIRHVAQKCRINSRTAQRRIRSLESLGEVIVIECGGKAGTPGGMRSNRYRIVVYMPGDGGGGDLPGGGTDAREGVAPVPGEGVAPVPPEPSFESSVTPLASATADAEVVASLRASVIEACSINAHRLTASAEGALNKAVRELVAVGATPAQVPNAAAKYRGKYSSADLTPLALTKHWDRLGSTPRLQAVPTISKAEQIGTQFARIDWTVDEARAQIESDLDGTDDRSTALGAFVRTRQQMVDASASLF
jgi:hypothetical protein